MSKSQKPGSSWPGRFVYGPRATRQDTAGAMRADIVRGLIEAITNADDGYGSTSGKILIDVSPKSADGYWTVSVSDRACGISAADVERKLVSVGERTSGHEKGEKKRGNRGRGAKDLAIFGGVRFESVCGDDQVLLAADRNGNFTEYTVNKATDAARKAIGVVKSGTRVTITCRKNIPRKQFDVLKRQLQNAVPLRQIMSSPNRTVLLSYGDRSETLRYVEPKIADSIYDGSIAVAGYGDAHLALFAAKDSFRESGDLDQVGGIVIQSGGACHESTLFGAENHPYADNLFGRVSFDAVDDLARELDDLEEQNEDPPDSNPFPIISRIRDGLEKTHPAYRALRSAVRPIIDEYLKRAADSAGATARQSRGTERRNELMARELVKWTIEQEQEIDSDLDEPGVLRPPFEVIPSRRVLEHGQKASFALRARADIIENKAAEVKIEMVEDPVGSLKLNTDTITLALSAEADRFEGTVRVAAGEITGEVLLSAKLQLDGKFSGYEAEVLVSVVEPVEVPPIEAPAEFQFASQEYRLQPGKTRRLLLMAPAHVIDKIGRDVILSCSDQKAVALHGNRILLEQVSEGWYEGDVAVEGLQHGGEATIVATTPAKLLRTSTKVIVRDNRGPQLKIKIEAIPGPHRAVWEETKEMILVRVNASHPAAQRYFGNPPEFPLQNRLEARVMLAEAVADVAVQTALKKEHDKFPAGLLDIDALQAKRSRKMQGLLSRLHSIVITDHDWEAAIREEGSSAPSVASAGPGSASS